MKIMEEFNKDYYEWCKMKDYEDFLAQIEEINNNELKEIA